MKLVKWDLLVTGLLVVSISTLFYTFELEVFMSGLVIGSIVTNSVYLSLLGRKKK